ncbi:MAG: sugar transferase [bacterium]
MNKTIKLLFFSTVQYVVHAAILFFVFWFSYQLRFSFDPIMQIFPPNKGIPDWSIYQKAIPFVILIWTVVTLFSGYYRKNNINNYDDFFYIFKAISTTFLIIMAVTFMYRDVEYSRLIIMSAWVFSTILIFVSQAVFRSIKSILYLKLFGAHRICVMGKGKPIGFLKDLLNHKKGYKSYFYEKSIKENLLRRFLRRRKIEEVLVVCTDMSHDAMLNIASICESLDIAFRFIPDIFEIRMGELIFDQSFGIPMFHLKPTSLHGVNYYFKRFFDVVFSIMFVSAGLIPFVIISLLIKLETKGDIFYTQNRVGFKAKYFKFYKFRTMIEGADNLINNLKHLSERDGPVFKMKNDPRITTVGKILRAYSLDEIPQIINVLKGDMSIVGPRPQVIWEAEAYDDLAKKRLNIVPGITGLWQVSGRASLSYDEMIALDLYYLENWSPGLDIKIILMTLPTILSRSGAY